ncbi:copper amine oxidase N-terminal domain-containing protein [Sporanaerobium hydrogeniformans]|uniref:copper amine oxidase N-terminal domain-containing protein n=1 Tax=Sporanaerobium hydrogeniformans TaxID=3072179 RepID=UPI0015D496B1|nr:copper amine oxidase N-terminal domain-containing protein [Sporanaerobium hydrogeniformans]
MNRKKLSAILLSSLMLTNSLQAADLKIVINGEAATLAKPLLLEERTYVPLRFVSEALGAKVEWNGEEKSALLTKGNKLIKLFIDKKDYLVDNKAGVFETAPFVKEGTTYVPARFVSESLDGKVNWDPKTFTVSIDTASESVVEVPTVGEVTSAEGETLTEIITNHTQVEQEQNKYVVTGTYSLCGFDIPLYEGTVIKDDLTQATGIIIEQPFGVSVFGSTTIPKYDDNFNDLGYYEVFMGFDFSDYKSLDKEMSYQMIREVLGQKFSKKVIDTLFTEKHEEEYKEKGYTLAYEINMNGYGFYINK